MRLKLITAFVLALATFCGLATLSSHAADTATQPADDAGFTTLYNGKDLAGWTYSNKKIGAGYQIDPEARVLYCTKADGGNLVSEKEYDNFVLRFEFKLEQNANNGIGIRAPFEANPAYGGMEIQILDDTGPQYMGKLRPEQWHGSVYDLFGAKQGSLKPVGEWNEQEITADGRHITVKVNGTTIVDANLDDIKDEAKLKKHPGITREKGHIVLMGHGTRVEFRNIRVKSL